MPQEKLKDTHFRVLGTPPLLEGPPLAQIFPGTADDFCQVRVAGKDRLRCKRGCPAKHCMTMLCAKDLGDEKLGCLTGHWCVKKREPFLVHVPKGYIVVWESDFEDCCPICRNKGHVVRARSRNMPLLRDYGGMVKEGEGFIGCLERSSSKRGFEIEVRDLRETTFVERERVFLCKKCCYLLVVSSEQRLVVPWPPWHSEPLTSFRYRLPIPEGIEVTMLEEEGDSEAEAAEL